jgi:hypothetical protein
MARAGCLALCLLVPSFAFAGDWININPGGGGAFTSIGAGPTGILLCGADVIGAYRSLDHGLTWDLIGSERGLKRTHVSAVGFDPLDPQILYLGSDVGLYRSADGGASFQQVLATGYIGAVMPARGNPAIVYATYHPSFNSYATDIYRSTDRGVTWNAMGSVLPAGLRLLKLAVSPVDPNTLYAVSGEDLFLAGTPALYRSTDGGASWAQVGVDMGNVWDLAIDPLTPSTLYATVYQGTPKVSWSGWVSKSTDGGDTWTPKGTHTGAILLKRDQPQVLRVIDVNRHSVDSESGVWESQDAGETWQRKSTMTPWDPGWQKLDWAYGDCQYGMPNVLGEDLSNPDGIFWITSELVFGSTNGGLVFQNLCSTPVSPGKWRSRGVDNVTLSGLAISEASPNQIYTGYHDLGLWRSLDGGLSWEACNNVAITGSWHGHGGHATTILADPVRPGVVWASNGWDADSTLVARSTSAGAADSWVAASGVPTGYLRGLSLARTSPVDQRVLYVTSEGDVYRSLDDGATWSLVFDCNGCRATAVDRFDGQLVYAGGEAGLWRSRSGGTPGSWERIGPLELGGNNTRLAKYELWEGVHAIVPDPQASGRAWVAAYGTGRGIYRMTDAGDTWSKLRNGTYLRDVAVNPVNPALLYAAGSRVFKSGGSVTGSEGVLLSINGGQTWTSLNDGLAWPYAGRIAIDPANPDRLIIGSPGAGFFERTLTGVTVGVEPLPAPGGIALSAARPNPAPGVVAFTLELARPARVEWSVHDLQGREVWRGAQDCGAGVATLEFDPATAAATRLRGGIYFARFGVEGRVLTRRFALLQ